MALPGSSRLLSGSVNSNIRVEVPLSPQSRLPDCTSTRNNCHFGCCQSDLVAPSLHQASGSLIISKLLILLLFLAGLPVTNGHKHSHSLECTDTTSNGSNLQSLVWSAGEQSCLLSLIYYLGQISAIENNYYGWSPRFPLSSTFQSLPKTDRNSSLDQALMSWRD